MTVTPPTDPRQLCTPAPVKRDRGTDARPAREPEGTPDPRFQPGDTRVEGTFSAPETHKGARVVIPEAANREILNLDGTAIA